MWGCVIGRAGHIEQGDVDPSFVITHRLTLDEAPAGYRMFRDKQNDCIKVVLQPNGSGNGATRFT